MGDFSQTAGDAATGAALGTMVSPGIGTAIGGVAGGLYGLLSGNPSDDKINAINVAKGNYEQYRPIMQQAYMGALKNMAAAYGGANNALGAMYGGKNTFDMSILNKNPIPMPHPNNGPTPIGEQGLNFGDQNQLPGFYNLGPLAHPTVGGPSVAPQPSPGPGLPPIAPGNYPGSGNYPGPLPGRAPIGRGNYPGSGR